MLCFLELLTWLSLEGWQHFWCLWLSQTEQHISIQFSSSLSPSRYALRAWTCHSRWDGPSTPCARISWFCLWARPARCAAVPSAFPYSAALATRCRKLKLFPHSKFYSKCRDHLPMNFTDYFDRSTPGNPSLNLVGFWITSAGWDFVNRSPQFWCENYAWSSSY